MNYKERIVLVLQGGGALGAYQAGAYEQLAGAKYQPSWVAGISIGAINAAIIAGNEPKARVPRLREFWDGVSSKLTGAPFAPGVDARAMFNRSSAAISASAGIPGFFAPRVPPAALRPAGTLEAISHYDTAPLRATLERLVDFDRLNSGAVRLSVGAVNVATGNFAYFDTARMTLGPEHVMASGALPPGFPPVEIDGQLYWDGGLVSNTPLHYVLDDGGPREDMCVFQIDLFNARGPVPNTIWEVEHRQKDIRFSSRTRLNTDVFRQRQKLRQAARRLCAKLPEELKSDPDALLLDILGCDAAVSIVHLIHRRAAYQLGSKDYEFSRISIEEHWKAGQDDVKRTLRQPAWRNRTRPEDGVAIFDLTRDGAD
jgi:NTE family protein